MPSAIIQPWTSGLPSARAKAAFTNAKWLNACGKLPSCRWFLGSYSSASSPRWLHVEAALSNSLRASRQAVFFCFFGSIFKTFPAGS
jgi:hypothetical protein